MMKHKTNKKELTQDRCKSAMIVDFENDTLKCSSCKKSYINTPDGLLLRYDL